MRLRLRLWLAQFALRSLGFAYGRGDRQEREASGYSGAEASGQVITRNLTLSPAIVATITVAEQIFPMVGVLAGDALAFVNKPTTQAGLGVAQGRISSAGNVAFAYVNPTAAGITPTAAEVYVVGLFRR
jgi:hypothetical protein